MACTACIIWTISLGAGEKLKVWLVPTRLGWLVLKNPEIGTGLLQFVVYKNLDTYWQYEVKTGRVSVRCKRWGEGVWQFIYSREGYGFCLQSFVFFGQGSYMPYISLFFLIGFVFLSAFIVYIVLELFSWHVQLKYLSLTPTKCHNILNQNKPHFNFEPIYLTV